MPRIKSFDLARGFTVLMIAPIHTVMLYSKLSIRETLMGKLMAFIAEGPGAQLFMMIMGIFFALSPKKHFSQVCKRAFYLLITGYTLNIFKFVIPHYFGWLPVSLLHDLNIDAGSIGFIELLSIGDILQFAAIATLTLYFIDRVKQVEYIALFLALVTCILSNLFWDMHSRHLFLDHLLQLLGGAPPQVFFPFFPWIVYPLIGLAMGIFIKRNRDPQYGFWLCRDFGWMLIILVWVFNGLFPGHIDKSFYRTDCNGTYLHLGIVLVTLSIWQWIQKNVRENYFFEVLTYMSRNITSIYIIQWIIICWLLPVFGYQQLGFPATLCTIALTTFLTITISFFFKKNLKKETPNEHLID